MDALRELASLTGMVEVKKQVDQIIQFHRISKMREKQGLKTTPHSNHLVFTGAPGTGKTTAARLIGNAFAKMGLLSGGNSKGTPFVEVHQSDIASKYAGEAEKTMVEKFEQARGGVLFIDEAYAFIDREDSSNNQGEKVITVVVQLMEDMRDEVMVIAAGYPSEMEQFLDVNPGLRSRFSNAVHFPNYRMPDLLKIAKDFCQNSDYVASPVYLEALSKILLSKIAAPDFGIARTVRSLVEQSIKQHSVRVSDFQTPSREDLTLLLDVDIPQATAINEKEHLIKQINDFQQRLLEIEIRELTQRV
jgi:stage V sporulation protein K